MANPTDPLESGDLTAKVFDLADMINYQEGSVVSRTLVKKATGTVTLFAFDQGQSLSEHTAPFDAMACVLDGEGEVTIAGQPLRLKAGQMIVMPAHKPHSVAAPEPFKMLLVMIRS